MLCNTFIAPAISYDVFERNYEYTDKIIASYSLVENPCIEMKTGENQQILVSYVDENQTLKSYDVTNAKVVYCNENKIEIVEVKMNFLKSTKPILYLKNEQKR